MFEGIYHFILTAKTAVLSFLHPIAELGLGTQALGAAFLATPLAVYLAFGGLMLISLLACIETYKNGQKKGGSAASRRDTILMLAMTVGVWVAGISFTVSASMFTIATAPVWLVPLAMAGMATAMLCHGIQAWSRSRGLLKLANQLADNAAKPKVYQSIASAIRYDGLATVSVHLFGVVALVLTSLVLVAAAAIPGFVPAVFGGLAFLALVTRVYAARRVDESIGKASDELGHDLSALTSSNQQLKAPLDIKQTFSIFPLQKHDSKPSEARTVLDRTFVETGHAPLSTWERLDGMLSAQKAVKGFSLDFQRTLQKLWARHRNGVAVYNCPPNTIYKNYYGSITLGDRITEEIQKGIKGVISSSDKIVKPRPSWHCLLPQAIQDALPARDWLGSEVEGQDQTLEDAVTQLLLSSNMALPALQDVGELGLLDQVTQLRRMKSKYTEASECVGWQSDNGNAFQNALTRFYLEKYPKESCAGARSTHVRGLQVHCNDGRKEDALFEAQAILQQHQESVVNGILRKMFGAIFPVWTINIDASLRMCDVWASATVLKELGGMKVSDLHVLVGGNLGADSSCQKVTDLAGHADKFAKVHAMQSYKTVRFSRALFEMCYAKHGGSKFVGVNLSNADLSGVTLKDANLTGANLTGAVLTDVTITGANVADAKLDAAGFEALKEGGCECFEGFDLSAIAVLTDVMREGTDLERFYDAVSVVDALDGPGGGLPSDAGQNNQDSDGFSSCDDASDSEDEADPSLTNPSSLVTMGMRYVMDACQW